MVKLLIPFAKKEEQSIHIVVNILIPKIISIYSNISN